MKKNVLNFTLTCSSTFILFALFFLSCDQTEKSNSNIIDSFEYSLKGDTINLKVNGLKQGKWIETINGKKDTVYYKNDTVIN